MSSYADEPVFGCSLEKLCHLEKKTVPRFVEECILAIEQKEENLKTDGIYRASGNLSQVQKIRLQVCITRVSMFASNLTSAKHDHKTVEMQ